MKFSFKGGPPCSGTVSRRLTASHHRADLDATQRSRRVQAKSTPGSSRVEPKSSADTVGSRPAAMRSVQQRPGPAAAVRLESRVLERTEQPATPLLDLEKNADGAHELGSLPPRGSNPGNWKTAVALCTVALCICSIDRAAISVALLPMSSQFHWTDTTKGAVSSAFFVGYTVTNLFGGYIASRFSPKLVLGGGVIVWSLFTMLTPTAAAQPSLWPLLLTRASMGIGEGLAGPAISAHFAGSVPRSALSRALSLSFSGGQMGNLAAMTTAPALIAAAGWPASFWVYGALGLAWATAWFPLVEDAPRPKQDSKSDDSGGPSAPPDAIPWRRLLSNKPVWATLIAHCSFGVGPFVVLSWMPTFLSQEYGIDVGQTALLSAIPWTFMIVCSNSAGWAADNLITTRGWSITRTRKGMQSIASLAPAACLLLLAFGGRQHEGSEGLGLAVGLLTATIALGGFYTAGYGSSHQDLSPRYAGVLFGVTNASASLSGFLSVYATGILLDYSHGDWTGVWLLAAGAYLIGWAAFTAWGSGQRQAFD